VTTDSEINPAEQARLLAKYAGDRMTDADVCAGIERFYPACMMAGASIEAALLAQVLVFEPELREAGRWKDGDDPLSWGIELLIQRAVGLKWLPVAKGSVPSSRIAELLDGKTGDAIRFIQYLRNVTGHPGKHVTEVPWLTVGEDEWELVRGIASAVFEHLSEALEALRG
jgi:hypothetical protein